MPGALHFSPQQSASLVHPPPPPDGVQVQATVTPVTSAFVTVPLAAAMVHVCPLGWVRTETLYVLPLGTATGRVNVPSAVTATWPRPLFARITVPPAFSPPTVPPILNELVAHVILTLVTFAEPIEPLPLATVHV
jgi:hypothetical protein